MLQPNANHLAATSMGAPLVEEQEIVEFDAGARLVLLNPKTLRDIIAEGEGPPVIALSKRRRGFFKADLIEWAKGRRRFAPGRSAAA
jgi:hypothetical protein